MLVGGVVDDEVDDDADAAVARGPDHLGEVARRAQPPVDPVEVGDVVAVVALAARVERHEPHARDAQAGEVVEPVGQPGKVAAAVAVGVEERLDVEAVDDRVLPPQVAGGLEPHSGGSTCSPKTSMNAAGPGRRGAGRRRRTPARRTPRSTRRGAPTSDETAPTRPRPRAARTSRRHRTARPSPGPSTAAARTRSCATGRTQSPAPRRRSLPTRGGPARRPACPHPRARGRRRGRVRGVPRLVDRDQPVRPLAREAGRLGAHRRGQQRRRLGRERPELGAVDRHQAVVVDHLAREQRPDHIDTLAQPGIADRLARPWLARDVLVRELPRAERDGQPPREHLGQRGSRLRDDRRVIPLPGRVHHAERQRGRLHRGPEPRPREPRLALALAPRREVVRRPGPLEPRRLRLDTARSRTLGGICSCDAWKPIAAMEPLLPARAHRKRRRGASSATPTTPTQRDTSATVGRRASFVCHVARRGSMLS